MRIRYKVWIEKEGETLLSYGKYLILKEVEKTGSIRKAAQNLKIPYKKAHSYIKLTEERFGKKLFIRKKGMGTVLTDKGKRLLQTYERILEKFEETLKELEEGFKKPEDG